MVPPFLEKIMAKNKEQKSEMFPTSADTICVGVNACKGKFGIAGKVFESGKDIILTKADMENRIIDKRVAHAKKLGMIK